MSTAPYTQSKKTTGQRRDASRKSGASATTAKSDGVLLAEKFEPFLDATKDPNATFKQILKELRAGNRATYDEIEAALLMLMAVNVHAVAAGGAIIGEDEESLTVNIHLVALEKIQCILRSFTLSRGKAKPKRGKREKTAMQKKAQARHASKTMVH